MTIARSDIHLGSDDHIEARIQDHDGFITFSIDVRTASGHKAASTTFYFRDMAQALPLTEVFSKASA